MRKELIKTSKFLSYILRHKPHAIGLQLDENGWVSVDALLLAAQKHGKELDFHLLEEVVRTNEKKRFSFSDDGTKIRANQGHSISVDLQLESVKPPEFLYHGTATRFLKSIEQYGLKPSGRHHVHLSADYQTALLVGIRHGKPVVLKINAGQMHSEGMNFFVSENGVWLTEGVSPRYFTIVAEEDK